MRLLVVEDSELLCESLKAGLSRLGYAVDVVRDGRRGLSYARSNPYDVVILDVMLPSMDGIEVLRSLRAHGAQAHVLMLTARDRIQDRVLGLRAGADDYLVKPFDFQELVARIQALGRRRYGQKAPKLEMGTLQLDTAKQIAHCGGRVVPIPPRQYALLEYLARRPGEVVSRIEIEDALYDEHTLPEGNAVDSAICRLRAWLGSIEGAPRIETLRGRGYLLLVAVP